MRTPTRLGAATVRDEGKRLGLQCVDHAGLCVVALPSSLACADARAAGTFRAAVTAAWLVAARPREAVTGHAPAAQGMSRSRRRSPRQWVQRSVWGGCPGAPGPRDRKQWPSRPPVPAPWDFPVPRKLPSGVFATRRSGASSGIGRALPKGGESTGSGAGGYPTPSRRTQPSDKAAFRTAPAPHAAAPARGPAVRLARLESSSRWSTGTLPW